MTVNCHVCYRMNVEVHDKIYKASNSADQPAYATFGDTIYSTNQHIWVFSILDIHTITTLMEARSRSLYQIPYRSGVITVEHRQIRSRRSMEIKRKKLQVASLSNTQQSKHEIHHGISDEWAWQLLKWPWSIDVGRKVSTRSIGRWSAVKVLYK